MAAREKKNSGNKHLGDNKEINKGIGVSEIKKEIGIPISSIKKENERQKILNKEDSGVVKRAVGKQKVKLLPRETNNIGKIGNPVAKKVNRVRSASLPGVSIKSSPSPNKVKRNFKSIKLIGGKSDPRNKIRSRSGPYVTRSDSPARVLRNGKRRKLASPSFEELAKPLEYIRRKRSLTVGASDKVNSESEGNACASPKLENGKINCVADDKKKMPILCSTEVRFEEISQESLGLNCTEGDQLSRDNNLGKSISSKIAALIKRGKVTEILQKFSAAREARVSQMSTTQSVEVSKENNDVNLFSGKNITDTNSNLCGMEPALNRNVSNNKTAVKKSSESDAKAVQSNTSDTKETEAHSVQEKVPNLGLNSDDTVKFDKVEDTSDPPTSSLESSSVVCNAGQLSSDVGNKALDKISSFNCDKRKSVKNSDQNTGARIKDGSSFDEELDSLVKCLDENDKLLNNTVPVSLDSGRGSSIIAADGSKGGKNSLVIESKEIEGKDVKTGEGAGDDADESGSHKRRSMRTSIPKTRAALLQCLTPRTRSPKSEGGQKQDLDSSCQMDEDNSMDGADERVSERISESCKTSGKKRKTCEDSPANVKPVKSVKVEVDSWAQHEEEMLRKAKLSALSDQSNCKKDAVSGLLIPKQENMEDTDWSVKVDDSELMSDLKKSMQTEIRRNSRNDSDIGSSAHGVRVKVEVCDDDVGGSLNKGCDTPKLGKNNSTANDKLPKEVPCLGARKRNALKPEEKVKRRVLRRGQKEGKDIPNRITRKIAANIGVRRRRNPAATAVKKSIATTVRKGRAAAAKKDAASKTIAKGTAVSNGDEHSAAVKQGEQTATQNMKRPGVEKKRDASASDAKKSLKKTVEAVDVSKLRGGLQGKKEESELKDASFEFSTKMKDHPPLVDLKNVPGEVATNTQQVTSEEHEVPKELNSNSVENTGEIPSVSTESLKEECPVVESMDVDDSVLSDKAVTTSPSDKKVISQDPALSCEKEGVNAVPSLAADNLKEIPEAPTVIATDFPSIEKCNPVLSSTAEPAEEDVNDVTSSGKKESVSSTSCTEETDNALQDAAMTKENTTISEVEVISSEGTACSNTETASTNEVVQKNSTSLPVKSEERTNNNTVEMSDTICSTVSEKMMVDPISLQEEEVSSVSSLTVEKAVNISSATNDEKKDILVSSLEKKEIMDVSDSEVNKNDNLCSATTEEVKDISRSLNDNKEEEVKDISASTVIKKDNIFSVNADKIKDILTSLAEAKDKVNETTDAVVEKANSICSITEKTNSICSVTATEKTNSICSVAAVEEKDSLICVVKEEEDAVSSVLASIVEKVNNICSSDTEGSKDIITCLVEKKNGEIKDTLMSVVEEPTNVCAITAAVKIETVPLLGDELMNVKKVNIPNKLVDEVKDTVESLVMSVEKVLIQHTVLSEENVVKECVELKEEEPISIDCSNTVKELKTESNQEAVEMPKILKPEEVNERIKDDKPATSLEKEDEKLVIPGACEVQSEEKGDVIAKLENGLGQLKSIDIDIEMSQIGDLSNDSNRCKTTSDSESTLEAENRSSTNDKLSEDSNTLDECEMLKGLDGIPLSVDGKNEDPLHVEDLKDLDTVGIREGGGLEEVSPEDQAIKESILSALGLQSRQSKSTVERKDTSYTGTLKTVIKLQRSPEKRGKSSLKMVFKHDKSIRDPSMPINGEAEYADDDDVEMGSKQRIEYRICKEADSLLDGGGDPTNFGVGNRKCLKPFTYRSYFELSTNSPFLTEHPAPAEENALDKDGGNKDDGKGSVKQVGSNLVIPEKSASFSIHPERLCSDVCSYCFGKFGSLDTPCHIAQLKNSERQKKILATETHLTADSCLCDACYRHVDRKANCPSYKVNRKRHHRSSSAFKSPCCVLGCSQLADHQVRRKWLLKLKRSIAKKVMIDMDKHPQHLPFPLCSKHYYWVDYFMVCGICKRRLTRNHMYPVGHEVHDLNSALSKDGIPVVLTEKLFLCKLCRYFSSLCLKYKDRSLLTANHKVFFDDYRRRILHYNDVETMDGEETSEPASLPPKTKRRRTKEKADSDPGETDGTADDMGDRTGATTPVMDYSHLDYPSTSSVKGPKLRLKIGNKSNGSDAVNGRSVSSPEGQDDMAMAANFVFHEPHSNGSTSPSKRKGDWEQCTASIQFSKETKKLFQELQRPYGNHSSFLRHLVLMEKYWRAGELMLSQTASSRASCYVNSVLNRLRAFDGVPSTRPATSTSSTFVPPLTPISSAGLSIVPVPVPASPTLPIIDLPLRRRSNVNNSPSSSNRIAISTGGMIVSARPMTLTSMSLTSGSSTATRTTSSSPATIFTTVPAVQQSGRKIIIDSKTVPLAGFTSKGKLAPNILQVTTGGGKSFSVVPSPAQLRQLQALKQQQQQLQQRQLVGPSTSSSSAIAAASTSSSSSSSSPSSSSSNFIPKICDVRSLAASDSSIRLWNKSELDVIPRPPKPQQQPVQPKLSVTILPKPSGSGIRSTTPVNIAPKPTTFVTPTGIILSRNPDISVSSIPVQRENTSSGC